MISKLLSWKCFLFHENESNFGVGLEFSTTWRQISWDHWWLFIGCVLTPSPIYIEAACALLFRAEKDTGKRSGIQVNTSATSLPQPHWLAELRFSNGKERSRHYCPRCNEQRRNDPTGGWRHSSPKQPVGFSLCQHVLCFTRIHWGQHASTRLYTRVSHHSKPASFVFFEDKAEVYLCLWFDSFRCTELHSAILNMFQLATAEFSSVSNHIRCKIFGSSVQRVKKLDQSSRSATWWWRHHHSNPECGLLQSFGSVHNFLGRQDCSFHQ